MPEAPEATAGMDGPADTDRAERPGAVDADPFLMIARVLAVEPGERAVGLRNVTAGDPLLTDGRRHPAKLRHGLLVEAFTQLAAEVITDAAPGSLDVSEIDSMKFLRTPTPGDQLVLTVAFSKGEGEPLRAACRAEAEGVLVAEGTLTFVRSATNERR